MKKLLELFSRIGRFASKSNEWKRHTAGFELIEAPIRYEWVSGAKKHFEGKMAEAVACWTAAMQLQSSLAKKAKVSEDVRILGPSWVAGIGHIAYLEFFAKARIMGLIPERKYTVLAHGPIGNRSYLDYYRSFFDVIYDGTEASKIRTSLRSEYPAVVLLKTEYLWIGDAVELVQRQWETQGRSPLLALNADHRESGIALLESWGIPRDAWFVAVHVREQGLVSGSTSSDSVRNADVSNYLDAFEAITQQGGYVVRLGGTHFSQLPALPGVVDYATQKQHEDWIDIYLLASASFVIATNSGPAWVPGTFGTPALFTNWAPPGIGCGGQDVVLLRKHYFELNSDRLLTLQEQQSEPIAHLESIGQLAALGLEVRQNSAQEILSATRAFMKDHGYKRR